MRATVMTTVKNIAILVQLSRPYDREVLAGIAQFVQSRPNWRVYIEEEPGDKVPSFAQWSGDGMIIDLDDSRIAKLVNQFDGPIVGIGTPPLVMRKRLGISTVRTDDEMIAHWAADHLIGRGLQEFAYCGMRTRGLDRWAELRRDAFEHRIRAQGYRCAVFSGRLYSPRRWNQMLDQLAGWIERLPKPVGLMACNDVRGRHVFEACRKLELRIPEDVVVVGVDNDELMCELTVPPLSSIAQDAERIGYEAARLLGKHLSKRGQRATHIVVPPKCVVTRGSTDLVAIEDDIVANAVRYIRERATEVIGVPDVVRHVGVSRSTLENRFRERLSRTVHGEILRERIGRARRMMATTDLPQHTIAKRAGFSSVHYMSAVFRREFGQTPGNMRRLHKS